MTDGASDAGVVDENVEERMSSVVPAMPVGVSSVCQLPRVSEDEGPGA